MNRSDVTYITREWNRLNAGVRDPAERLGRRIGFVVGIALAKLLWAIRPLRPALGPWATKPRDPA